jgi:competence protein ComEC
MAVAGEAENSEENDAGVVGVAETAGLRVLVTGDIEVNAQLAAVASGQDLHADVLKAPHHGSARQVRAFWQATQARAVVFSVGLDNDYGHPTPSAVRLAQDLGMTILRTDQQASVAVTTGKTGWQSLTQQQGRGA